MAKCQKLGGISKQGWPQKSCPRHPCPRRTKRRIIVKIEGYWVFGKKICKKEKRVKNLVQSVLQHLLAIKQAPLVNVQTAGPPIQGCNGCNCTHQFLRKLLLQQGFFHKSRKFRFFLWDWNTLHPSIWIRSGGPETVSLKVFHLPTLLFKIATYILIPSIILSLHKVNILAAYKGIFLKSIGVNTVSYTKIAKVF